MRRIGYVRSAKEKKLWPSLNNRWARPGDEISRTRRTGRNAAALRLRRNKREGRTRELTAGDVTNSGGLLKRHPHRSAGVQQREKRREFQKP